MVEYARKLQLQFYAIESALPPNLPWGHFAMLGVVRKPLGLMISHCGAGLGKRNKCVDSYGNRLMQLYFSKAAWQMGGGKTAPVDTEKNLKLLKERLDRFSLVLILERFGEAGPLLAARFGWKKTNTSKYRSGTHRNSQAHPTHYQKKPLDIILSDAEFNATIHSRTAMDHEIYHHANVLFDRQLKLLQDDNAQVETKANEGIISNPPEEGSEQVHAGTGRSGR